jgi:energy-coupling factor transporter ATP-binding protein EcfA2
MHKASFFYKTTWLVLFCIFFSSYFATAKADNIPMETHLSALKVYDLSLVERGVLELPTFDYKDLEKMGRYNVGEFIFFAYARLIFEVANFPMEDGTKAKLSKKHINLLLNYLLLRPLRMLHLSPGFIVPDRPARVDSIDFIKNLKYSLNERGDLPNRVWYNKILELETRIEMHEGSAPSVHEYTQGPKKSKPQISFKGENTNSNSETKEAVDAFRFDAKRAEKAALYLDKNVKGQPEAVQHFADYIYSIAINGFGAEKPSIVMLMGQPGTGKDTVAEAFVDALHEEKGKHKQTNDKYGVDYLFRIERITKEADIWSLLGSATGYVGSNEVPAFIRYLVLFSGGKYKIRGSSVQLNPDWKPGMVLPGFYPPEMGVIFINEEHDWSKRAKNLVLKELVEKGRVKINAPGEGGVSSITFSGKIIAASNIGIDLVTSRNLDGTRNGEPLSFEEMKRLHEVYAPDKTRLGEAMMNANVLYAKDGGEGERGYTEEYINRYPLESRILMRPLSPESLREILEIKLQQAADKWANNRRGIAGSITFTWDHKLVDGMMDNLVAEENARPLDDRVSSFLEKPLYDAFRENKVELDGKDKSFFLDIEKNSDRTSNLVVYAGENRDNKLFEQLITATLSEKPNEKISKKELQELLKLEEKMNKRVFGAEKAIKAMSDAVILIETDKSKPKEVSTVKEASKAMLLLGPTSTGKSETMKALAEATGKELVTIDFNQVSGPEDMKKLFYGYRDGYGRPIPSVFMQEYDKHNGNVIFNFEEFANLVFKGLGGELMALYDILREETVTSFIDNKPRSMKNVLIGMPGNLGKEWYDNIPKDIPMMEQMDARQRIYEMAMESPSLQRNTLERGLTEAFVARLGMNRVFFYAPHTFTSLRQLTMLKLNNKLRDLGPRESALGWNIEFDSKEDYLRGIEQIERHGFDVSEQGASIDKFVKDVLGARLNMLLVKEAPTDTTVFLRVPKDSNDRYEKEFTFEVVIEGQEKPAELLMPKAKEEGTIRTTPVDMINTAYHEIGHHFVGKVLLGDKMKQTLVTIEPGVMEFSNGFIRYLGVAVSEQIERLELNREAAIERLAVMLAGAKAQEIINVYNRADIGKAQDIKMATELATKVIMEGGLSPEWGNRSIPADQQHQLSEADRVLLAELVDGMLKEAETLAEKTILLNFKKVFAPLSIELAKEGTLKEEDFRRFYEKYGEFIVHPESVSYKVRQKADTTPASEYKGHNHELKSWVPRPADSELFDVEKRVETRKMEQVSKVEIAEDAPIRSFKTKLLEHGGGSCKSLF